MSSNVTRDHSPTTAWVTCTRMATRSGGGWGNPIRAEIHQAARMAKQTARPITVGALPHARVARRSAAVARPRNTQPLAVKHRAATKRTAMPINPPPVTAASTRQSSKALVSSPSITYAVTVRLKCSPARSSIWRVEYRVRTRSIVSRGFSQTETQGGLCRSESLLTMQPPYMHSWTGRTITSKQIRPYPELLRTPLARLWPGIRHRLASSTQAFPMQWSRQCDCASSSGPYLGASRYPLIPGMLEHAKAPHPPREPRDLSLGLFRFCLEAGPDGRLW